MINRIVSTNAVIILILSSLVKSSPADLTVSFEN